MPNKEFRTDRFTFQKDEAQAVPSQCSNCLNNTGIGQCAIYGEKPVQFAENKETCPDHDPE